MNEYSSLVLAYIGDAHYALTVKRYLIDQEVKVDRLQRQASRFVSARSQAAIMEYLLENNCLSEEEIEVYKRGRNSKSHKAPRNTDAVTYHVSTGFEALWGWLYLEGRTDRLEQIWNIIRTWGGE
ncbi:MAG: ribonuclease III [Erysipelotrichaceae bacterium]|nr:ribonuclease III [Erysipelotrichaceae bacterium]